MHASSIRAGTVAGVFVALGVGAAQAEIDYPQGFQDFEAMAVDDSVMSIGWEVVNTSSPTSLFTIEAADDVLGSQTPRGTSTRWLRITDTDSSNVQNRFYSPAVIGDTTTYKWTYYVNLETTPPGGADTKPKFTIQHFDNGTSLFGNAWGVEFTSMGANLIVLGIGGTAASMPLYSLASPTGIGDWVKISLRVDFASGIVSAQANDGTPVSLPINLSVNAERGTFRLCYRGEGNGNAMTMLLDDPSVWVAPGVPTVSEWGAVALGLLVLTAGTVMLIQRRRRTIGA